MRGVVASLLALVVTTSYASAEVAQPNSQTKAPSGIQKPVKLTDQQLDATVAGHCSEANPGSDLEPHGQGAIFCSLFENGHPIFIMTGHNGTGQVVFPGH